MTLFLAYIFFYQFEWTFGWYVFAFIVWVVSNIKWTYNYR